MNIFNAISLGAIQGLTEFIPISSSGHLIIAREFFGWQGNSDLSYDAILQLATVLAVIVYFRKDIMKLLISFIAIIRRQFVEQKEKIMVFAIIIGTIPAILFGLLLETYMETVFRSALLVSVVLIIGSLFMYVAEKVAKKDKELSLKSGLFIGLFQCLALLPGFSRSGATISGGLFMGLNREEAARFSFLLSVPILLGSGLKKLLELVQSGTFSADIVNILAGSITSFIIGLLAIDFLMKYLKKHTLNIFVTYRIILAFTMLFILL